jgi:hypothetical protein
MGIGFLVTGVLLLGAAGNWVVRRVRGTESG